MENEGPYVKASYIPKLQQTGVMALTDLDGTMTMGDANPSSKELSDRASVRELLERKGVVTGAVTARTCALTLSSGAYSASPSLRKVELPPKWGIDPETKKRVYIPLEDIPFFDSCKDFDITASFGGFIIVRNGHGYEVDTDYENLLRFDHAKGRIKPEPWRLAMLSLLYERLGEFQPFMSKLESRLNYDLGLTDSAPLDFRFQFDFEGSSGLEAMIKLKTIIADMATAGHSVAVRIKMVDESKPNLLNPEKSRYTLYLIPWGARKETMIKRLFEESVKAAKRSVKSTRLLYTDDTLTGLRAGLWVGGEAPTNFLLPVGSRLAPYLIEKKDKFGDEDLSFLWEKPIVGREKHRLLPTNERGVYRFEHKVRGQRFNTIVIGDERYADCTAPGSVGAFFEEFL
jgi:hypothetical protein